MNKFLVMAALSMLCFTTTYVAASSVSMGKPKFSFRVDTCSRHNGRPKDCRPSDAINCHWVEPSQTYKGVVQYFSGICRPYGNDDACGCWGSRDEERFKKDIEKWRKDKKKQLADVTGILE